MKATDTLRWCAVLSLAVACLGAPSVSESPKQQLTEEQREGLIKGLERDLVRAFTLKAISQTLKIQQDAENRILDAAMDAIEEQPGPERQQHLEEVAELLRRDRRQTEAISGLLGGSSGSGDSSSSSSGAGGSDSGSILNLLTPLLGSSSAGGGGSGEGSSGGLNKGALLGLLTPLLGSSSGGGGSGDGAGGGSGLSSILGISSSSSAGGGSGGASGALAPGSLAPLNIKGQVKGAKVALVGDGVQLLLRVKFGILSKVLDTVTNLLAAKVPLDQVPVDQLKYPS